jgi:predicted aconitase with swiveling domain
MSAPWTTFRGRVLSPGEASGTALVLEEPLSLWGGMDPATGRVIDAHHPQHDELVSGRVLVMVSARGSSSSSSILAESVRAGTAPAAILLGEVDLILPIGASVAEELYGRQVPIVVVAPEAIAQIAEGAPLTIGADGLVSVASGG